ncbi:hypothetical protein HYU16_01290 [Candidatus Woesearchaeota archaeon]|nr:hypothetical protein [Candidatus Woesearchaeota archaeon]
MPQTLELDAIVENLPPLLSSARIMANGRLFTYAPSPYALVTCLESRAQVRSELPTPQDYRTSVDFTCQWPIAQSRLVFPLSTKARQTVADRIYPSQASWNDRLRQYGESRGLRVQGAAHLSWHHGQVFFHQSTMVRFGGEPTEIGRAEIRAIAGLLAEVIRYGCVHADVQSQRIVSSEEFQHASRH